MREVVRQMPSTIKPIEWKLVVVLADAMATGVREGRYPGGRKALCERMGMSDDSVKRSLNRLAELGYEVRVPIGKYMNGTTLFAVDGADTTYRIPVF